jgi:hypothetical protein
MKIYSANLAQLVEQLIRNEQVAGSIPAVGSELKVFTFRVFKFFPISLNSLLNSFSTT